MAIEDSGYKGTPGVKITTAEVFEVEGKPWNKFHTTRELIVEACKSETLRNALAAGKRFKPVYCKAVPREGKNTYYEFADVE